MEIILEKFNYQKDLVEQRKLFLECFPENNNTSVASETHYKWKFKSFPTTNIPAYEYVAKLEDEIIGYYASIPYEYIIRGEKVTSAMVCDVMTGIKARGKGVFTKLGEYSTDQFKIEGLQFSTGYPIRPEVIPGHKKAGWEFPFQIPMYGKFLRFDSFLKKRKKNYLIPAANVMLTMYNLLLSLSKIQKRKVKVENYSSLDISRIYGLDLFLTKWIKENQISLNKNIEFLNWRLSAPEKLYEIIILREIEKNMIVGYSIVRNVEKECVPCVGVLDFCLLEQYANFSSTLFNAIKRYSIKTKSELILMMMMKKNAKKYNVFKNGFLKTPYKFSFIIKNFSIHLKSEFLFDENNWSLMWIDSDDL